MTEENIVTNDVFDSANTAKSATTEQATQPQSTNNTITTESYSGTVGELVGEGKKYKTLEALASAVIHKDEFIETLKNENKEARDKLEDFSKADKVFKDLTESKTVTTPTAAMTPEQIQQLVTSTVQQTEQQKVEQSNIKKANDELVNKLGSLEKATEYLNNKANELGLSVDFLMTTAAKSPSAFMNVLGVDEQKTTASNNVMESTKNTQSISNFNTGANTNSKEYFDEIRKNNKAQYYSAKVQNAITAAVKKGEYF